jgi:hypothetical protein
MVALTLLGATVNGDLYQMLSRFEALLPHGQLRLTFGEMQLPIIH